MVQLIEGGIDGYQEFISKTPVVLVDFYAVWCGPCRMIAPILESFEGELKQREAIADKVAFGKVDVDADQELAMKMDVSAMPTFLIYKSGELFKTIVGANAEGIKTAVEEAITALAEVPA